MYYFFFFICFQVLAHGFSEEKLKEKLTSPFPQWMLDEVHADLAPYVEKGITREMVRQSYIDVNNTPIAYYRAHLFGFEIKDNIITAKTDYRHIRIVDLIDIYTLIAKYVDLPDTEFLVSIWDRFDNPSYTEAAQVPIFVICKEKYNSKAARIPWYNHLSTREHLAAIALETGNNIPWEEKTEIAYWRGSTTDMPYNSNDWDYRYRARAVLFSREHPDLVDAHFSHPAWLEESMYAFFKERDFFVGWQGIDVQTPFKYLLAIDGASFPSNLYWAMHANSVIVKAESDQQEWFYGALKPFVHYVPYKADCSDLKEVIEWLRTHDDEARQIAKNATELARKTLTNEDLYLYFYILIREYAKLMRD